MSVNEPQRAKTEVCDQSALNRPRGGFFVVRNSP